MSEKLQKTTVLLQVVTKPMQQSVVLMSIIKMEALFYMPLQTCSQGASCC